MQYQYNIIVKSDSARVFNILDRFVKLQDELILINIFSHEKGAISLDDGYSKAQKYVDCMNYTPKDKFFQMLKNNCNIWNGMIVNMGCIINRLKDGNFDQFHYLMDLNENIIWSLFVLFGKSQNSDDAEFYDCIFRSHTDIINEKMNKIYCSLSFDEFIENALNINKKNRTYINIIDLCGEATEFLKSLKSNFNTTELPIIKTSHPGIKFPDYTSEFGYASMEQEGWPNDAGVLRFWTKKINSTNP